MACPRPGWGGRPGVGGNRLAITPLQLRPDLLEHGEVDEEIATLAQSS
jgi:hypothetical protein